MKKIAISKLSHKLQNSIIKEVRGARSINYEEEQMSKSKMPEWFKIWNETEFVPFKKNQLAFNEEVLRRLERIENTPTMKRELAETYK